MIWFKTSLNKTLYKFSPLMDLINLTHYYFYYVLFHSLCLKHGLRSKTLHLLHKNQICYHSTNNYKRLYLKDYQKKYIGTEMHQLQCLTNLLEKSLCLQFWRSETTVSPTKDSHPDSWIILINSIEYEYILYKQYYWKKIRAFVFPFSTLISYHHGESYHWGWCFDIFLTMIFILWELYNTIK